MKKIFIILLTALVLVSFCVALPTFADEMFTVRFYSSEGNFTTQTVTSGSYLSAPATPIKAGHTFKGWTLDGAANNPAVISVTTYRVYSDVDFFAVFMPNNYKVTFKYFNAAGIQVAVTQNVVYNDFPVVPDIPLEVNGSAFLAWNGDTNAPVTAAITFTAEYNPQYFSVTYYDADGQIIDTVSRSGIEDITDYEAPQLGQKLFRGWALSSGSSAVVKNTYRINGDVSLYAVYGLDIIGWFEGLELWHQILVAVGILFALSLIISLLRGRRR